jgi:hypothetical protein
VRFAILALAACAHLPVSTQSSVLVRHGDDFAGRGYAHVEVDEGGTVPVSADDHVVVTIPGNETSHLWGLIKTGTPDETREVTVGTFVAGCDRDGHGPDCLASRTRGPIRVGTQRRLDPKLLAIGLFGALATVVGITCLSTCSNLNGWAWVGTGIGVITFIVPMATIY